MSEEIKIKTYKDAQGSWRCETYVLGHLFQTYKRGSAGIICTARECVRVVEPSGWVGYRHDLGLDGAQARAMAVEERRRASRSMVQNVHSLGLHEFYKERRGTHLQLTLPKEATA